MTDGFLPFSRREIRLADSVDGMARIIWRRYYREIRLWWRAEVAQWEHDVMWGRGPKQPKGILHCAGLVQRRAR